jgi:hypothetical protein
MKIINHLLPENRYCSRKDGKTKDNPIGFQHRTVLVLLDEVSILITSTTQMFDGVTRFQLYESPMRFRVKGGELPSEHVPLRVICRTYNRITI